MPLRAFAAAWLLALAACSPGNAGSGTENSLIFLSEDIPAGLDYDGPAAAIATTQTGFVNVMEPLVGYAHPTRNEDGVALPDFARVEGRLAERWSYDPGTLTWTITLRRGVKSCTGNELTSNDVVYTFARAKSVSGAAPIGWFLSSVASIDGFTGDVLADPAKRALGTEVRALDRYTVAIRQSAPNRLFLPALTTFGLLIFDAKEMRRHATAKDSWSHDYANQITAPSFGAYCVERWAPGDQMVLKANAAYYRGPPAIGRVVIKRVPQSSNRFILVKTGQAQLAERLTPREFVRLRSAKGVRVAGVTGNENLFLHMNWRTRPFDDVRVRRAIAAALPVRWIVHNGYFGQARAWRGVVPSIYPGFVPAAGEIGDHPRRAEALLAEAGYPGGRGLVRFSGAFKLAYIAEKESSLGPIASAIRTALTRVGVPIELDPIPSTQYGDRQLVKKDLPFALNDQEKPVVVDAGYAVQLFFASDKAGGVNNMVNYARPEVDALWSQARVEPDTTARNAILARIQQRLAADLAWAPVVEYRTQWAASNRLQGLAWHPDNAIRFADLRFAR